jgi:hypothetical protein
MPVSPSSLHSRTTACSYHPALTTIMVCSAPKTFASISIRKLAFMNSLVDIYAQCRRFSHVHPILSERSVLNQTARSALDQAQPRRLVVSGVGRNVQSIEWSFAIYRPVIYQPLVGHSIRRFINISAVDFHRPTHPIPCQRVSPVYTHPISSQCLESSAASDARSIWVKWAINSIWTRSWY